jgi:pSer/pThr/pTyr-binding forkhead associated (FHA) protein
LLVELISLDYVVPKCDTSITDLPVLIGHAGDCQICLDDHSVSNHHCEIDCFNGSMGVRDLDSVHGTFVNAKRISKSQLLPGDQLAVGALTFLVGSFADSKPDCPPMGEQGKRAGRRKSSVRLRHRHPIALITPILAARQPTSGSRNARRRRARRLAGDDTWNDSYRVYHHNG